MSADHVRHWRWAWKSPAAWSILLITFAIGLGLDLGSKWWTFEHVAWRPVVLERELLVSNPRHDPVPRGATELAIPHILQFRLVINRGAVFGLGANRRAFFIGFTLVALAGGLAFFGTLTGPRSYASHFGVGLVMAGGAGNLYDRVAFGAVRDFLHMFPGRRLPFDWTWPGGNPELFPWVFNIADMMLLAGMLLLMAYMSRRRERVRAAAQAAAQAAEAA